MAIRQLPEESDGCLLFMNVARTRWSALVSVVCLTLMVILAGCSSSGHKSQNPDRASRSLTSSEAERLAVMRFNAYDAKMRSVDATIIDPNAILTLRGWIKTTTPAAYALVTPSDAQGPASFLTLWTAKEISAAPYAGTVAPRPAPTTGWQSTDLKGDDSALAAAQLLIIGLSSDRPDNPQLLLQSTAQWLRKDTVGGVSVDVISGPVSSGTTSSGLRYWIDERGNLMRAEARLDGQHWSTFDFADTPNVTF